MRWGHRHDAQYQVLQAQPGSTAECLYLAKGLRPLGRVHVTSA